MLSYMLPTEDKPNGVLQPQKQQNYRSLRFASSESVSPPPPPGATPSEVGVTYRVTRTTSLNMFSNSRRRDSGGPQSPRPGSAAPLLPPPPPPPRRTSSIEGGGSSPKHQNGSALKPSLLQGSRAKDESLDSDGSSLNEQQQRKTTAAGTKACITGPKQHANLKRSDISLFTIAQPSSHVLFFHLFKSLSLSCASKLRCVF